MKIFDFFRASRTETKSTAQVAKERLQIVLAHERVEGSSSPDFLPALEKELLAVIAKYVKIQDDKVEIKLDRADGCSTLEVNIELPTGFPSPAEETKKVAASG